MNDVLPKFLLKIVRPKVDESAGGNRMFIIVQRPYAQLEAELTTTFRDQPEVKVMVDRREADRRSQSEPVSVDRRQASRRREMVGIIDVVISS